MYRLENRRRSENERWLEYRLENSRRSENGRGNKRVNGGSRISFSSKKFLSETVSHIGRWKVGSTDIHGLVAFKMATLLCIW